MDKWICLLLLFTFTGQSLSQQEGLLIYADCYSKEFELYSLDGSKLASRSSFRSCPESIAFTETDSKRVYWIEATRPPSIGYLNIKNGDFERVSHHVDLPDGLDYKSIQVDHNNGLVYFIANESIIVKSLEENMGVTLDIPADAKPSLLAIDPKNKYMFWYDNHSRELVRANLDGSNAGEIFGNFPVNSVNAITLDIPEQRIYITINDRMGRAAYDGRGHQPVVSSGDASRKILSIGLDNTRVMYTTENNPHIFYVNKTSDIHSYGSLFSLRRNPDVVKSMVTSYATHNKSPNECSVNNGKCSHLCVAKGSAGKTCLSGIPKDVDVRLTPTKKVELRLEGQWHTVCADNFGVDEAIVVCRELRHFGPVKVLPSQPGTTRMMKPMRCPYSAVSLSTCLVSSPSSTCNGRAAAVDCQVQNQGMTDKTNKTLGGGRRASEGRLEVFHQGAWSPVCDPGHFFNKDAASALCRNLGYQRGDVSSQKFTEKSMVASWRQDFKCYVGAPSLDFCYNSPWQQVTCHPDDIIAVECFPSTPEIWTTVLSSTQISTTNNANIPDLAALNPTLTTTVAGSDLATTTSKVSSTNLDVAITTTKSSLPEFDAAITATKAHMPDFGRGTIILQDDKGIQMDHKAATDLPVQSSTEKTRSRSKRGPAWLVAAITSVGTVVLIVLTVSLSVFCYRRRKRQEEPFGIHSNPLVQQMSMMEQNELMLKYLEEKRQLGCLSDSRSSLNYNAAGVLLPGSLEGTSCCKLQDTNPTKPEGNLYESIPHCNGARNDNSTNERIQSLQKDAKMPIWRSPLPDVPSADCHQKMQYPDDNVYLEPVKTNSSDNYYATMCQSNQDISESAAASKDEDNYDIPKMAKRKMSIDPRNPVF